jgi:hypothetical protein
MLPASTSPSAPAAVILDITSDNWTQFNKAFTLSCYTKFGVAGQQILSNREIPLTPFAVAPTKQDVDATLAGVLIPGQFTYARRATTAAETALPGFDLATISLTESANREYRDDLKLYTAAARIFAQEDTDCLDHLHRHISLPSHTSIKTHTLYSAYQLLPIGKRSFTFYTMARDIHSIGNATTKLHRTRQYVNISQADLTHEQYMEQACSMAETFNIDFESSTHPGYILLKEFHSFIYLAGLDRTQFRRAIDETLQTNPTGRFPDHIALMAQIQTWKVANALSFTREAISTQGSALIAAKTSPPTKSPKKDTTPRSHLHPSPCTWCLSTDKVSRYGHLSSHCSKNPNRLPGPSPPPANATATPTPRPLSNTFTRLHALLSQLDVAMTPTDSNAAMLLIAEAAIGASDYPDSA